MIEQLISLAQVQEEAEEAWVRIPEELDIACSLIAKKLGVPKSVVIGSVLLREDELDELEEYLEKATKILSLPLDRKVKVKLWDAVSTINYRLPGAKREVKVKLYDSYSYVPLQLVVTFRLADELTKSPIAIKYGLNETGFQILEEVGPILAEEVKTKRNWLLAIENVL